VHEKFTAAHKSHYKEDFLLGHKHVAHSNQKGVVGLQQNIFFQLC